MITFIVVLGPVVENSNCGKPILEYACEVFHFALPKYLSNSIERVQRRITSIIFPGLSQSERLEKANLTLFSDRRRHACLKLFNQITKGPALGSQVCS